jgi:hypothetical protein
MVTVYYSEIHDLLSIMGQSTGNFIFVFRASFQLFMLLSIFIPMRLHLVIDVLHYMAANEVENMYVEDQKEREKANQLENGENADSANLMAKKGKKKIFFGEEFSNSNKLDVGKSTSRNLNLNNIEDSKTGSKRFVKMNLSKTGKGKSKNGLKSANTIYMMPGNTKELNSPDKKSKDKKSKGKAKKVKNVLI